MAQELINIGALADDGTGDTIRNAGRKINANFTEFFALPVVASDIRFEQNNIVSKSSNADIWFLPIFNATRVSTFVADEIYT